MIPAFSYQGGKARIRDWLCNYFPKTGNRYVELFTGRGNVFFAARQQLGFNFWELYDRDASFLSALKLADLNQLPTTVRKADFEHWKSLSEVSLIAKVIEPAITFAGKGYRYGYRGERRVACWNFFEQRDKLNAARKLLQGCTVNSGHWRSFAFDSLCSADFLYLDPPYYNTEGPYPNIDHMELINVLNQTVKPTVSSRPAPWRWALSGYESELYAKHLKFVRRFEIERNAEMAGPMQGFRKQVLEVLWLNY